MKLQFLLLEKHWTAILHRDWARDRAGESENVNHGVVSLLFSTHFYLWQFTFFFFFFFVVLLKYVWNWNLHNTFGYGYGYDLIFDHLNWQTYEMCAKFIIIHILKNK